MEMERLRREDHLRVKHDKLFSDWKILVGPEDWQNHTAGEDGSQRYRLHNLPASYFGPGVYELGLTQQPTTHDFNKQQQQRKLRRHAVVVVYLGQADNVRQRLQRYGQTGSHLEGIRPGLSGTLEDNETLNPKPHPLPHSADGRSKPRGWFDNGPETSITTATGSSTIQGGLRLFTEVFSRGYSIAFRWARTESKQMAEKVESELLHVFDYPWNTSLNGARRPRDILAKLDLLQYQMESSLCLGRAVGVGWRKWEYFGRKVGISVPVRKPNNETRPPAPPRAKIPTSFFTSSTNGGGAPAPSSSSASCGVLLEDGSACSSPPVKGRRRCAEHKGQRAKVSSTRRRTGPAMHAGAGTGGIPAAGGNKPAVVIIRAQMHGKRVEITDVSGTDGVVMCGARADGGAPCVNRPVQGRKRCAGHKGIRVSNENPKVPMFGEEEEEVWSGWGRHSTVEW